MKFNKPSKTFKKTIILVKINKELKDIMEIIANESKEPKGKVTAWKRIYWVKTLNQQGQKKGDAQTTWRISKAPPFASLDWVVSSSRGVLQVTHIAKASTSTQADDTHEGMVPKMKEKASKEKASRSKATPTKDAPTCHYCRGHGYYKVGCHKGYKVELWLRM